MTFRLRQTNLLNGPFSSARWLAFAICLIFAALVVANARGWNLRSSSMPASSAAKDLQIYFVDVEGGQATLFVTPSGESLLVDTGWPGNNGRDADRIVAAAKKA